MRRSISLLGPFLLLVGVNAYAAGPEALVGATQVTKIAPEEGFVDDVVATDDARIAYIVTDGSTKATLHALTLATNADVTADISGVTLHPVGLYLVGKNALVVGQLEDGQQIAQLVELGGKKILYKLGPATHITVIARDGKQRIVVNKEGAPTKTAIREEIALYAIENGAKLGAGSLEVDEAGTAPKLDFKINHWTDGMSRAVGVKGGTWDPKENERMPDTEATYDVVAGKFVEKKPISDLFEQRKRFTLLHEQGENRTPLKRDFFKFAWDNQSVALWHDSVGRTLELDQALNQYDPKSIQGVGMPDGSAWFTLRVDPTNAAAVERKKADPEYLDIFHVGTDTKAQRKARVYAKGHRFFFGTAGTGFWLLDRSNGLERGSTNLAVYKLAG